MSTNKPSYYGPFFWVAAISFAVPLVVAARAFQEMPVATKPTPHPDVSGVDHALWDYLLKTYVEGGLVDYDGMQRDYLFRTYVRQLAEADPDKLPTSSAKLALFCNAYNAFVIDGVITHKIRDSVMNYHAGNQDFFSVEEHIFCGKTVSLNHIEGDLIRKRFQEPRIHVALVCAARSCPTIRPEAYTGARLDQQLEDQSILFANDTRYVAFDAQANALRLSPILKWYGDDWEHLGGYLLWLGERVRDATLKGIIQRASRGEVPVTFFEYDWSLNAQVASTSTGGKGAGKSSGFGSGSIPNE